MSSISMRRREVLTQFGMGALVFSAPILRGTTALAQSARATVAQDIARWLEALRYEDLPANVVTRAKNVVLDTLGCAIGALDAGPVRVARQVVALQGGNPQATIVGVGGKVACDQAAFLNGMALRYLDYNDYIGLGRDRKSVV